jgi:Iap family predicted aminopeptidase
MNNNAATEYVENIFSNASLNCYKQEFDCICWENKGAILKVIGQQIEAIPSDYSLGCDIEAEFIFVDSVEKLANSSLEGKIAILHGQLTQEPLMPKQFVFYNPESHKKIIAMLEEKNPIAIVTVSPIDNVFFPIIEDGDFTIPVAIIKKDSLDILLKKSNAVLTLKIEADRIDSKACNLIATNGSGKKITLTAHIDTKPNTVGALDNACGVAVLLAIAEKLKRNPINNCIEIAILNGEDYYSTPGELAYMNTHLSKSDDFKFCINIDGIALKNSNIAYSFFDCDDTIKAGILAESNKSKEFIEIDPWPQGDHMMFVMKGVPSIALTSEGIFDIYETIIHTPKDNLSLVDLDKAAAVADFLYSVIEKI